MASGDEFKLGDIKTPDDTANDAILQKEDIVVEQTFDRNFAQSKEELGLPVYTYHGGGYSYVDWNHRFFLLQRIETLRLRSSELDLILATLRNEVFRRGIAIMPVDESGMDQESPNVMFQEQKREIESGEKFAEDPDKERKKEEWEMLNKFLKSSNQFNQSLQQVLEQGYDNLNTFDDVFMYYLGDYDWVQKNDEKTGKPLVNKKTNKPIYGWHFTFKGVRTIHPLYMEISVNSKGVPGKKGLFCRKHRTKSILMQQKNTPRYCNIKDCGGELINIYYVYHGHSQGQTGGTEMYFSKEELTKVSKNRNTELYGFSKLIPLYKKIMSVIGMDEIFKDYFFDRKNPSSLIFVTSDNPKDLQAQWGRIKKQLRQEADEVPMIAVSATNGNRGRIDHVKLAFTPQEMNYLELRNDLLRHIGSAYGVSSSWLSTPTSKGGVSAQTTDLTITSNVAEKDQKLINEKILTEITKRLGVKHFTLQLLDPHEKAESTQASIALNLLQVASAMSEAGLKVKVEGTKNDILNAKYVVEEGQFLSREMIIEQVGTAKAQREMMELQVEALKQQGSEGGDIAGAMGGGGMAPPGAGPGGGGGGPMAALGGGGGLQLEEIGEAISNSIDFKPEMKFPSFRSQQNKMNGKPKFPMKNILRESKNRNVGSRQIKSGTVKNRKAVTPDSMEKTPYDQVDSQAQKE